MSKQDNATTAINAINASNATKDKVMENIIKELQKRVLVGDGAMGTNLQEKGLKAGEVPEEWNVSKSEIIRDVHRSFIDAGSDLIVTNTFGANRFKLKHSGFENKVDYFNKKASELALEVAGGKVYVLGDIGPSGELLKPYGDIEPKDLYENFREQVLVLKDTGIDAFILETFSDINEVELCIKAVRENSDLPVISSLTFQKLKDDSFKTMMGVGVYEAIEKSVKSGCYIVGTNCGNGSKEMLSLLKEFNVVLEKYNEDILVVTQPNAGNAQVKGDKTFFNETPEYFKEVIPEYLDVGVNILGGCCGTTPKHVEVIKKLTVQSFRHKHWRINSDQRKRKQ